MRLYNNNIKFLNDKVENFKKTATPFKIKYMVHYLFEGLTKSYNILQFKKYLIKKFPEILNITPPHSNIDSKNIKFNPNYNSITITVDNSITYSNLINLISTIENLYGWEFYYIEGIENNKVIGKSFDISEFDILDKSKYIEFDLTFTGKFTSECLNPKYINDLYHITNINKFNKIKKQGLVPKSSNKFIKYGIKSSNNKKIYLGVDLNSLIFDFEDIIPKNETLILRISKNNVKELLRNDILHLFDDGRNIENYAYFTYDNIHPKYLEYFDIKTNSWKKLS